MSPRKFVAALAVAALSLTGVANAEDAQEGLHVDVDYAGTIIETVIGGLEDGGEQAGPGYTLTGECTFAGVLSGNNRLNIVFGGYAVSTGPQVPQLTYIKCTIFNEHGQTASAEFANGGPVTQTAGRANSWFVSPLTVCIEGFAVFGPTPVTIITMNQSCTTPEPE